MARSKVSSAPAGCGRWIIQVTPKTVITLLAGRGNQGRSVRGYVLSIFFIEWIFITVHIHDGWSVCHDNTDRAIENTTVLANLRGLRLWMRLPWQQQRPASMRAELVLPQRARRESVQSLMRTALIPPGLMGGSGSFTWSHVASGVTACSSVRCRL
jgi:hypothetical protein